MLIGLIGIVSKENIEFLTWLHSFESPNLDKMHNYVQWSNSLLGKAIP